MALNFVAWIELSIWEIKENIFEIFRCVIHPWWINSGSNHNIYFDNHHQFNGNAVIRKRSLYRNYFLTPTPLSPPSTLLNKNRQMTHLFFFSSNILNYDILIKLIRTVRTHNTFMYRKTNFKWSKNYFQLMTIFI